ncbi:unnamed protein product [Urochloa humidicola]
MESQENAAANAAAVAQLNLPNCRKRIAVHKRKPMPVTASSINPVRRSPRVASMQEYDDDFNDPGSRLVGTNARMMYLHLNRSHPGENCCQALRKNRRR